MKKVIIEYEDGTEKEFPLENIKGRVPMDGTGFPETHVVTEEQKNYASRLASEVVDDIPNKDIETYRDLTDILGKHRQSFLGFLSETVLADYHGIDRPELIEGDVDKGIDIDIGDKTYDVKCTENLGRNKHLLVRESKLEKEHIDGFILGQYDEERELIQFPVKIPRDVFEELSEYKPFLYDNHSPYRRPALSVEDTPQEYRTYRKVRTHRTQKVDQK